MFLRRSFILAIVANSLLVPLHAQQASKIARNLSSLTIEDLMNIQVTSVSKKEEKLSRTAAAIFVISQEDIRESGANNIPDLLRMVPGLDVAPAPGRSARGASTSNRRTSCSF